LKHTDAFLFELQQPFWMLAKKLPPRILGFGMEFHPMPVGHDLMLVFG